MEPESYGTMLSSVLLSKLPPELRLIVSRKVPADDLDMGTLLETFEQELIARERATSAVQQPNRRVRPPGPQPTSAFVSPLLVHQNVCSVVSLMHPRHAKWYPQSMVGRRA